MLFCFTFAVPLSSGASRQEEVDRKETGATIKVAHRPHFESHGVSGGWDGDAGDAVCQKRRSHGLPSLWQRGLLIWSLYRASCHIAEIQGRIYGKRLKQRRSSAGADAASPALVLRSTLP